MAQAEKIKSFDPDQLVLTKEEIVKFCDDVLEKWNKNPDENIDNIFAMNMVRTGILWTDEEPLKAIWTEILKWAFTKLYKNSVNEEKKVIKQQKKKPDSLLEDSIESWEKYYKNKVKPEQWVKRYRTLAKEYAENTNPSQKEKLYKEYLGLYGVLKKDAEKLEESKKDKALNF